MLDASGRLRWEPNPHYRPSELIVRGPGDYTGFGIHSGTPLYTQFEKDFGRFQWVSQPKLMAGSWERFAP
jgi:hypothetical protein